MKLKQLRKLILGIPVSLDECEVVLQKDSEGNGYSPLAAVDDGGVYIPESTYSGYGYDMNWTAYEAGMEEDEWAKAIVRNRAIILAPTN